MNRILIAALLASSIATTPALAADKAKDALPQVTKCAASYGSLAITDGDNQGWTQFGLGSPRELLAAIAAESGCFTMYNAGSGAPATFLMSAIAGSKEEVDQTVGAVKTAATEGLLRSGALGRMGGGAFGALGMLGGLGGKKKTVSVGLRILSPQTGLTVANGTADSVKSSVTFGGAGGFGWTNAVAGGASSYMTTKEGAQLTTAFINAFNSVVAQGSSLAAAPKPMAVAAAPAAMPTVAIDTKLYATPVKTAAVVRTLRAGTTLTATGKREGLFVEMKDSYGSSGWVSVEDLK